MKKYLSILLCIMLCIGFFVACDSDKPHGTETERTSTSDGTENQTTLESDTLQNTDNSEKTKRQKLLQQREPQLKIRRNPQKVLKQMTRRRLQPRRPSRAIRQEILLQNLSLGITVRRNITTEVK